MSSLFLPLLEQYESFDKLKNDAETGWNSYPLEQKSYRVPKADIVGELPKGLKGTLFRNGPGKNNIFGQQLKHPIDGDGLVCSLSFTGSDVLFKSKFVQTKSHVAENQARQFMFRGQMGTVNSEIISKDTLQLGKAVATRSSPKLSPFRAPSNTNVFYWGGKLLSCYETDLPYLLDPYNLETLGQDNLNGTLKLSSFSAHFRVDPFSDLLVTLSLKPEVPALLGRKSSPPSLQMNEYDRNWNLVSSKIHHIDELNYAHDFSITENYYIIHVTPFVSMKASLFAGIALGLQSPGQSMKHFEDLPSRFLIIPRRKSNEPIRRFECGRWHIFHFGNAVEKKLADNTTEIKFNAVCLGKGFNMSFDQGLWLANGSQEPGLLIEHTVKFSNQDTNGVTTSEIVDDANSEFPIGHTMRHGCACRYTYLMSSTSKERPLPFTDIVKYDSETKTRQVWRSHGVVGEPCFVPKDCSTIKNKVEKGLIANEDDGWIIVQLYNLKNKSTEWCILDAKNVHNGPICRILLHHQVPYAFHGTWCPDLFLDSGLARL